MFDTVDTAKVWHSQVCPRAIGGINESCDYLGAGASGAGLVGTGASRACLVGTRVSRAGLVVY